MDHRDERVLADKADQLWAHCSKQPHDVVAAFDGFSSEDKTVGNAALLLQKEVQTGKISREEELFFALSSYTLSVKQG